MNYTKLCAQCGVLFEKRKCCSIPSWFGNERRPEGAKFCSTKCFAESRKGVPAHNRGKPGNKWDAERHLKVKQEARKRRQTWSSCDSGVFSGGRWNYIRKDVFERDDYTCQECGFREPEIMCVDHVKPKSLFPDLMYSIDNCVTLCPNCHARKTLIDKMVINGTKRTTTIANA